MEIPEQTDEEVKWLDSVTVHDGKTFTPPIPFDQSGFHWRAATQRVHRAIDVTGEMATAVRDNDIVARGVIGEVEVSPSEDMAVLHVGPPRGGESNDIETQLVKI